MLKLKSINEQLVFTTVRIETKRGNVQSLGTGFLLSLNRNGKNHIFIVTCKHLLQDADETIIYFLKGWEIPYLEKYMYLGLIMQKKDLGIRMMMLMSQSCPQSSTG